ncbi:hypothetical protein ECG_09159 [Echinococcus granulosus]|uniref:Expressed protein n=1 Tax=Echinococcus granulosus TaxID=6210 RepID=A0A068WUE7_ECHGR|nr:hypothetical protein ECG_09159 [Echinococcus granulosus]CDS21243.1 expressed protein [Echinococcus granulosus]
MKRGLSSAATSLASLTTPSSDSGRAAIHANVIRYESTRTTRREAEGKNHHSKRSGKSGREDDKGRHQVCVGEMRTGLETMGDQRESEVGRDIAGKFTKSHKNIIVIIIHIINSSE